MEASRALKSSGSTPASRREAYVSAVPITQLLAAIAPRVPARRLSATRSAVLIASPAAYLLAALRSAFLTPTLPNKDTTPAPAPTRGLPPDPTDPATKPLPATTAPSIKLGRASPAVLTNHSRASLPAPRSLCPISRNRRWNGASFWYPRAIVSSRFWPYSSAPKNCAPDAYSVPNPRAPRWKPSPASRPRLGLVTPPM